jgi:hypothetical protein
MVDPMDAPLPTPLPSGLPWRTQATPPPPRGCPRLNRVHDDEKAHTRVHAAALPSVLLGLLVTLFSSTPSRWL